MNLSSPELVQNAEGENVFEYQGILDRHGYPLRFRVVNAPYPNRATRRKEGIRLPLNMLLQAQQLFAEEVELRQLQEAELGD